MDHPGDVVTQPAAEVGAVVFQERADVQPLVHREAVPGELVAQPVGIRDVAQQQYRLADARGLEDAARRVERHGAGVDTYVADAVAEHFMQVDEPAAVTTAHIRDEAGPRRPVEDLPENGIRVGEVAPMSGGTCLHVELALAVPFALAGGDDQLRAIQFLEPGKHGQVGADEPEMVDERETGLSAVGPARAGIKPAQQDQQPCDIAIRPVQTSRAAQREQRRDGERRVQMGRDEIVGIRGGPPSFMTVKLGGERCPGGSIPGCPPGVRSVIGETGQEPPERNVPLAMAHRGAAFVGP